MLAQIADECVASRRRPNRRPRDKGRVKYGEGSHIQREFIQRIILRRYGGELRLHEFAVMRLGTSNEVRSKRQRESLFERRRITSKRLLVSFAIFSRNSPKEIDRKIEMGIY